MRQCLAPVLFGLISTVAAGRGLPEFEAEFVATFDQPLAVAFADGETYVMERDGRIQILSGGTFLDIETAVDTTFEGGLLGMTFHPDFPRDPRLFVHYTGPNEGFSLTSIVSEFTLSKSDPTVADPKSERVLLRLVQPAANHNAGWLDFSPVDGWLYVAFGDGGGNGLRRAQDLTNLLGKMLRIGVNGDDFPADPDRNYTIPPGNPFIDAFGEDEIWASGLRNPFRCSFDVDTGDLYIADVGDGSWEEVDVQSVASVGGENYGWGCMEGFACLGGECVCNSPSLTLPAHVYGHALGCAITGGVVYRGCAIPELTGRYFFSDFCSNRTWSFLWDGTTATDLLEHTTELSGPTSITGFGNDEQGEVYITSGAGALYRIVPANEPVDTDGDGIPDSCEGDPADLDGDGLVTFADLVQLLASWGPCGAPCDADLDGSGDVGFGDLVMLLTAWTS